MATRADERRAAQILRQLIPGLVALGMSPTQVAYLQGVADTLDRPARREASGRIKGSAPDQRAPQT
jgi:hypothetical protein